MVEDVFRCWSPNNCTSTARAVRRYTPDLSMHNNLVGAKQSAHLSPCWQVVKTQEASGSPQIKRPYFSTEQGEVMQRNADSSVASAAQSICYARAVQSVIYAPTVFLSIYHNVIYGKINLDFQIPYGVK